MIADRGWLGAATNNPRKEHTMTNHNIVRAWKDEQYRLSLTEAERALLPEHPAGLIELSDAALNSAAGGVVPPFSVRCPGTSKTMPCPQ
jgi:mersacidin/lichenicidin family type 2 lantibiotic